MEGLEEYYNKTYSTNQLEADLRRRNRLRVVFPGDVAGKKILSIGCGPAEDIHFLLEHNEVHGIDISDAALSYAQKAGIIPHKLDLTMGGRLPFGEGNFDIIVATDILEHLFFPKDLLLEMHRVLNPEGYAIISVPNHFFWKGRLSLLRGRGIVLPFHNANDWDYFHIRFFTQRSFELLLAKVDFVIDERLYNKFTDVPRGLPHSIDKWLIKKYPGLFSMHFMVRATKKKA